MTREEILKLWPKAVWFPGDAPPAGTRVIDDRGNPGEIVGAYAPKPIRIHNCPDCTHMVEPGGAGLWTVAMDGWRAEIIYGQEGYRRTSEPVPPEERMVVLLHPSSLRPVVEELTSPGPAP